MYDSRVTLEVVVLQQQEHAALDTQHSSDPRHMIE